MTPANNAIYMAAITILQNGLPVAPIIYPGFPADPPSTGQWVEVSFFPNEGIDNGLSYDSTVIPQGIFQVECFDRPGKGLAAVHALADQVKALYPKGTLLTGSVRVIRSPYEMDLDTEPDRLSMVVSVEYSG